MHTNWLEEVADYLAPKHTGIGLLRVGGESDGAYLIPDDLDGVAACFSPGVANRKDFEDDLVDRFGIRTHMADFTSSSSELATPLREGFQTFIPKWVRPEGENSVSLKEWVEEMEGLEGSDLLLQMDIEGGEWENLDHIDLDTLSRFRILCIEFHGFFADRQPDAQERSLRVLSKLESIFVPVHVHPNNVGGLIEVPGSAFNFTAMMEVTYLRKDRVKGRKLKSASLPNPLDISWNHPKFPPVFLNSAWSGESQSFDSIIRQHEIEKQYLRDQVSRLTMEKTRVLNVLADFLYSKFSKTWLVNILYSIFRK